MKIDIGKTKEYYNSLSSDMLCDCDYCKLYYAKSRKEFSELALWLDKYGVNIENPFADMSLEPYESGTLNYIGVQYIVFDNFTDDNSYSLAFLEYIKKLDFIKNIKIKEKKTTSVKPLEDDLEEDEYGMPIKYRDEIMALSKQANRNMTKRWEAAIAKKEKEQEHDSHL